MRPGKTMRRGLLGLALVVTVGLLIGQLGQGARLPLFDFVEYWAAGKLMVEGHNPYDPEAVERLEREAGRSAPGVLMWNPPWTLPLVMPFGLLDVHFAQILWLLLQFVALVVSADALWLFFGGSREKRWIGWLIALSFAPALVALTAGQVSPLMLLGAVAFLYAERAGRPVLAGAATLLLSIKPHLVLPFFLVLVLVEVRRRRWSLLLSGVLAGVLATVIAMAFNPAVLEHYWQTLTTRPPAQYRSPTLGTLLREWLGRDRFALQFIPPLFGLAWGVGYWWKHRRDWDWERHLSLVLLVSLLTAAYGAWPFDLVLLLVPVVELAAGTNRWKSAVGLHLAINAAAATLLVAAVEYFWFLWMTPTLLLVYLMESRHIVPPPPLRQSVLPARRPEDGG